MLRRVLVPALAVSLALAPSLPSFATRQAGGRVIVVTVDGTSIQDWQRAGVFGSLGSIGLLATRTATDTEDPVLLRAAAYTTLGAGAAAELESTASRTDAGSGVVAGALGEALARAGAPAAALGDASGSDVLDAPAGRALMRADGSVVFPPEGTPPPTEGLATAKDDPGAPAGSRTDYAAMRTALERALRWSAVVVVDLGDTARADRTYAGRPSSREAWITRALRDAESFVRDARVSLTSEDSLIVASLVPPLARVDEGNWLAAVATTGPAGTLTSGTTRRDAVITLTDLGPTILDRAGVAIPSVMQGRAARVVPSSARLSGAAERDETYAHARSARWRVTRVWVYGAAALGLFAFVLIVTGRGASLGSERRSRRSRDLVSFGLTMAAGAPAAMFLVPAVADLDVIAMSWWILGTSIAIAFVARALTSSVRAVACVAAVNVLVIVADLVGGGMFAERSPLGFNVASGSRFYGLDEGVLGTLLASAVVAAGGLFDRSRRQRLAIVVAGTLMLGVAVIAAAPALGSKFGASFTLVPAFGAWVVLVLRGRFDRVAVIAIAIATVSVASVTSALDAAASPDVQSHIGRELAGRTPVLPLIERKLTGLVETTLTTIWLPVAVAVAVPAILLAWRRRNLLARGFWGLPGRRAALVGAGVGCIAGLVSNDTGIVPAAQALVVATAAFYTPLLAGDRPALLRRRLSE